LDVEVVRRFVEQEQVRALQHQLHHAARVPFRPDKSRHAFLGVFRRKEKAPKQAIDLAVDQRLDATQFVRERIVVIERLVLLGINTKSWTPGRR